MATIKRREGKNGASYLIRSSCGYDVTGKQIMRSMTWRPKPGMTEKQIEKELNRQAVLFGEKCSAQGIGGGNVKFETFSKQWFKEYAEPNLRPRTIDRLHQQEPRVYEAIGHIRLDRLTARHIQGFVHSLGEDGLNKNTGGKLSPKTIRNYIAFVSSILSYAVKMGIIQDNPCRRVTLPHVDRKEKEVYTLEEAQHFLESLEAAPIRYQTFCVLAIYSGLRRGELLGLEWPDIDFNNHTLNVRRSSLYTKEKGIFTDTSKTVQSQRTLKLPESVFLILRRYHAAQAQERLSLGDRWEAGERLFTTTEGRPLHPSAPYRWLEKFCAETGQRFLGIHSFRHLNASLMIGSGTDVRTVSAMLGHSQASTTLNLYAHSFAEAQARAGEAVANMLEHKASKTG